MIWVLERPEVWTRRRLNTAFAIHAGVWVAFILFLVGVWAASSHGYFWPVWVMLPAAIAVGAHAAALLLRSPDREALTERISTLETSRAGAVDVQEAELRRIERDLHDGAQARLVALGMSIGMAEQKMGSDPEAAQALLAEARSGAGEALRELRDLARGIHPPVLADRGLHAAIQALAVASPITVTVSVDTPERPKAPVESAAYFVVAESLANAGKYARATQVDVRISRVGDALAVSVTDNGVGGADPCGGGLSGLSRRVEALDGTLTVTARPAAPPRSARSCHAGRDRGGPGAPARRARAPPARQRLRRGGGRGGRRALLEAVAHHKPDIAVVDIRLPPDFRDEGLRAALELRRSAPDTAVLMVSQYVEQTYAAELLAEGRGGVGYLLKDRIMDVGDFVDAVQRVARGGTALDPDVVAQLVSRGGDDGPLSELTPREKEVLALMAEGRSNAGIAEALVLTVGAVEKHIASIFGKLRLHQSDSDHRRVLAVLAYLQED